MPVGAIATQLGLNHSTVAYYLRSRRIAAQRQPVERTPKVSRLAGRNAQITELHSTGLQNKQIAALTGIDASVVSQVLRKQGLRGVGATQTEAGKARSEKMATMYRQGVTLEKIGSQFNLTRERVRQCLKKLGIASTQGGQSVNVKLRRVHVERSREARSLAKYGLPSAAVQQLRKDRVLRGYETQKKNAARRGVEWDLDFASWFAVWQASGKLHLRGRGKGHYVMSRIRDDGGCALGNVHIQLSTDNNREGLAKCRHHKPANTGVYLIYPGSNKPWLAIYGRAKLGLFATEEEGVAARAAYIAANSKSLKFKGRGYAVISSRAGRAERYQVMVGRRYIGSFTTPEEALAARAQALAQAAQSSLEGANPAAPSAGGPVLSAMPSGTSAAAGEFDRFVHGADCLAHQ